MMISMRTRAVLLAGLTCVLASPLSAQDRPAGWERRTPGATPPLQVFHSTQAIALPTAETLQGGDVLFEISHRFVPPVSSGSEGFFGFDGPVQMRLALGYAPSSKLLLTLGRSNLDDNLDLTARLRVLEIRGPLPTAVALQAGGAWNTETPGRESGDSRNFQYFGQVIINTAFGETFALGVVPSYVHNGNIYSAGVQDAFSLGIYGHLFLSDLFAFIAETNLSDAQDDFPHDVLSVGIQFETGGHFFKIIATNSTRLNMAQFLPGTENDISLDEMRLGFVVTRVF
jgi:hypothetical protein